ncbi:MAG: hypothetical protein K1060chlam5_01080, partial [Candidatus Anoxychlamydiales bacterium]|nr:hypothetical protein [Candidatus Anoxychlamydiales bacterium]
KGGVATGITLAYEDISTLTAGTGTDIFTLTSGGSIVNINGNTGTNTYNLNGGDVTGTLTTGSVSDTLIFQSSISGTVSLSSNTANIFDFQNYAPGVVILDLQNSTMTGIATLSNVINLTNIIGRTSDYGTIKGLNSGHTWTRTSDHKGTISGGITLAFEKNDQLDGGSGTDTLVVTGSTFNITGTDSGDINGIDNFTSMQNLTGSSSSDLFIFSNGAKITGNINGNSSSGNILNFDAYATVITANLATGTITDGGTVVGSFSNIQNIIGSGSSTGSSGDIIIGSNNSNVWTMTGADAGTINNGSTIIAFSKFSNWTGGTNQDRFVIKNNQISGIVKGGSGADTLDYSQFVGNVNINFDDNSATNIFGGAAGGVLGFHEAVPGSEGTIIGTGTTIIQGANGSDHIWTIDGNKSGSYTNSSGTTNFSGVSKVIGGDQIDVFSFTNNGFVNEVDGSAGNNTINYLLSQNNTWNITDNNGGNINGNIIFSNIQNLTGGPLSDIFILSDQKGITGLVDGGSVPPSGTNTLDYSAYTTPTIINLAAGTATNIGAITRIQEASTAELPIIVDTINTNVILSYEFYKYTLGNFFNLYTTIINTNEVLVKETIYIEEDS